MLGVRSRSVTHDLDVRNVHAVRAGFTFQAPRDADGWSRRSCFTSHEDKKICVRTQPTLTVPLLDHPARLDVKAEDLPTRCFDGLPEDVGREGLSMCEHHLRRLLAQADRDALDALQASAQRNLYGCCACRSSKAANVSQYIRHADASLRR